MSTSILVASSPPQSKALSIDSNQLLTVCFNLREQMHLLEKSIKMVQLRLTTLSYINEDVEALSLKCFDNLFELSSISDTIAQLLDELRSKLAESLDKSLDYQIASQQLMFFTSEWYDNLAPKLNETFELAARQDIFKSNQVLRAEQKLPVANDIRVSNALLRLRQSMKENERLIVTIASNIDHTRTTIETIYDSLQYTKLGLDVGERNAIEARDTIRKSTRWRFILYAILYVLLVCIVIFIIQFLIKTFMIK